MWMKYIVKDWFNKHLKYWKLINVDLVSSENNKIYISNWLKLPDIPYQILIIGRPGSRETNVLLTLINYQPGVKYFFISKRSLSIKVSTVT